LSRNVGNYKRFVTSQKSEDVSTKLYRRTKISAVRCSVGYSRHGAAGRLSKHLQNVNRDVLTVAGGDQEVTGDVQVSWRVRLVQSHHVLAAACPIQGDR